MMVLTFALILGTGLHTLRPTTMSISSCFCLKDSSSLNASTNIRAGGLSASTTSPIGLDDSSAEASPTRVKIERFFLDFLQKDDRKYLVQRNTNFGFINRNVTNWSKDRNVFRFSWLPAFAALINSSSEFSSTLSGTITCGAHSTFDVVCTIPKNFE